MRLRLDRVTRPIAFFLIILFASFAFSSDVYGGMYEMDSIFPTTFSAHTNVGTSDQSDGTALVNYVYLKITPPPLRCWAIASPDLEVWSGNDLIYHAATADLGQFSWGPGIAGPADAQERYIYQPSPDQRPVIRGDSRVIVYLKLAVSHVDFGPTSSGGCSDVDAEVGTVEVPIHLSPPPTTQPPTTQPTTCTDNATYMADITIPDGTQMSPGQNFTKTWRMLNSGTCDWGFGHWLGFIGGDQMRDRPESGPFGGTHGTQVDISVNLTAPSSPGVSFIRNM